MQKNILIILIGLAVMFVSCDDETIINNPVPAENYSITFTGLPDEVTAPQDVEREFPFFVIVHNADGTTASGIKIELAVAIGRGEVSPRSTITDADGRIDALYSITMPAGQTTTQIRAIISGRITFASIRLIGVNYPVTISLLADTPTLVVQEGESGIINLEAVVTDAEGMGVPNVKLRFSLAVIDSNSVIFGSIHGTDYTDESGRATAAFHSDGGSGTIRALVSVDESGIDEDLTDGVILTIITMDSNIASMTMFAYPDLFRIEPWERVMSVIEVIVRDENRNGIPDLQIEYSADYGTLSQSTITDSVGSSRVQFQICPLYDLPNYERPRTITITAAVKATGWSTETDINVVTTNVGEGFLIIEPDRKFIWADGEGLSCAHLTAVLQDEEGQILEGKEITFTTDFPWSVVMSPMVTDSLGKVRTIFDDIGRPSVDENGMPDSVTITARYRSRDFNITASTRIMIRERNPVSTINLHVNASQLTAGSGDSTAVRATVYLSDASPAPPGTRVHFEAVYGGFTRSIVEITGSSGAADTWYIAGNQVATDTLRAFSWTPHDTAVSNDYLLELVSGPPQLMWLRANPTIISPDEVSTITARVLDQHRNPVRQGTYVTFSTTMGTVTGSAITDECGDAEATLLAGIETGIAVVTSRTNTRSGIVEATCEVVITSGTPNSIELEANPPQIQPVGVGGLETSVLTAVLRDRNGNMISDQSPVIFQIMGSPEPPEGPNLNDEGHRVEVESHAGIARAYLNAGTDAGSVFIQAYSFRDEEQQDTVRAFTTVLISGGVPFGLDIDIDAQGYDAGGGAWELDVAVSVWDAVHNPVSDGIPVTFGIAPDAAVIQPVVTGNQNRRGVSTPGIANARLIYLSRDTFTLISLIASVQSPAGAVETEREFELPLQRGELMLNVDPGNWMFDEYEGALAEIRLTAILLDGHGMLINNAPVLFTTNRARLYWYNHSNDQMVPFFPDPARKLTGIVSREDDEEPGQATVYLIAEEYDIYLDPFSLEVMVRINAQVEGYDDVIAEPAFIQFTRLAR